MGERAQGVFNCRGAMFEEEEDEEKSFSLISKDRTLKFRVNE